MQIQTREQKTEERLNLKDIVEKLASMFDLDIQAYQTNAVGSAKNFYHKSEDRIDTLNKTLVALTSKSHRGFTQKYSIINLICNAAKSRRGLTLKGRNFT